MKKLIALVLVLVMACTLLAGCGEKPKEAVKINIKLPILSLPAKNDPECDETGKFMQKAWDAFAAQYDKYDVSADVIVFEQTDYQQKIVDCYGKPEGADLMLGGYFTISGYIYDGYAVPLDDIITDAIKADFSESSWAQSRGYNGKTYLMPFLALQNVLSYNKELFRQCGLEEYCYDDNAIHGWSLEEWDTILSTLKENLPAGSYPLMMYAVNNQGDTHTMIQLRNQGSSFFNEEGLFNLNTPEGIAGLQWIKDNYEKGYYPQNCENISINDCPEHFVNNQLAIYVYNTALAMYAEQMNLGFVNFPGADAGGVNSNWLTGFMAFDNGDARRVEVTKDFLKFIYENPEWLEYSTGGVPCSRQVADKYADQIFMSQTFLDNEKYTVDFTANNPNWAGVRAAFWPHIQALLIGDETAAQAAAGLDADCNAVITSVERKLHE